MMLALLGALCAGGCAAVPFIPAQAAATLEHPTHVEAFRTGTLDDHPGFGGKMDGYAVFETGWISDEDAAELAAVVLDPATYRDDAGPADFVPTAGFRFYRQLGGGRGQTCVDVLIGFDHDQILLVARDEKLREDFRRMLDSAPGRESLVRLSQDALEFDQTIQSLTP
jgi:ABC-type amino acid transport substrate-binding protein